MNNKHLNKLEYNLILEKLYENCHTHIGKNYCTNLHPFTNELDVENELSETTLI